MNLVFWKRRTEEEQKHLNVQRLMALAAASDSHPLWVSVLEYADEHAQNELMQALGSDLSNAQRQFAAGRTASAVDFANALRDLKSAAKKQASERK